MQLNYQIFSSPIGEVLVAGTTLAITHIVLGTDKAQLSSEFLMQHDGASPFGKTEYVKEACGAIARYLDGKSQRLDISIQVGGTEFQRKVWQALRQIPYGKTSSYTEVAEAIGEAEAVRAVANACGSNPVLLIIPCHRVIQKNGGLGGFSSGIEAKRFLLNMEKAHVASRTPVHAA